MNEQKASPMKNMSYWKEKNGPAGPPLKMAAALAPLLAGGGGAATTAATTAGGGGGESTKNNIKEKLGIGKGKDDLIAAMKA